MLKKIKDFFLFDNDEEEEEEKPQPKPDLKYYIEKEKEKNRNIFVEPVVKVQQKEEIKIEEPIVKEVEKEVEKKTTMYEYTDKFIDKTTKVKLVEEAKVVEFKPSIFISPVHGASTDDTLKMREKKQEVTMKSTTKSKTTKSLEDIYKKVNGIKDIEIIEEEIIDDQQETVDQKSLFDYLEEDIKK